MMQFVITLRARRDLLSIWNFIAEKASPATADQVVAEFYDAIQLLAEQPGMGHTRFDVANPRYRFWCVYRYIIAYRTDRKPFTVARVIHGARDFKQIFK